MVNKNFQKCGGSNFAFFGQNFPVKQIVQSLEKKKDGQINIDKHFEPLITVNTYLSINKLIYIEQYKILGTNNLKSETKIKWNSQ